MFIRTIALVLATMAAAWWLWGCSPSEERWGSGRSSRAASTTDSTGGEGPLADATPQEVATPEAAPPDTPGPGREARPRWNGPPRTWTEYACSKIGLMGCCKGEVLWWCEGTTLQSRDCTGRAMPYCGWNSTSGKYGCNTAGASDPTGKQAKQCLLVADNAWLPDSGRPTSSCQGITDEGCCAGNVLKFCDNGKIKVMDCALNPTCGWQPNGQQYDCGTAGMSDPLGNYLKTCPGSIPVDGTPDRGVDGLADEGVADSGEAQSDNGGCACRLSGAPAVPWALFACLLLLLTRRRL